MNKIDKLLNDHQKAVSAHAGLEAEIEKLEADKQRLEVEAEAAAKSGDISLYREKHQAAGEVTEALYVRKAQLNNTNCLCTREDAGEAWQEYVNGYNREFQKAMDALERARRDLYAAFLVLLDKQHDALQIRESCAQCCGLDPDTNLDRIFGGMKMLQDTIDHRYFPAQRLDTPETNYFYTAGLASRDQLAVWDKIIRLHKSN